MDSKDLKRQLRDIETKRQRYSVQRDDNDLHFHIALHVFIVIGVAILIAVIFVILKLVL